jgi:hypothetical protein
VEKKLHSSQWPGWYVSPGIPETVLIGQAPYALASAKFKNVLQTDSTLRLI